MKKILVMLTALGIVFAQGYSRNWVSTLKIVSGNLYVAAPYMNSGLMLDLQSNVTVSVIAQGVTLDDIVRGARPVPSYYPLNWTSRGGAAYGGVTLNALTSANVNVTWYENNN